jgi:hypothetical protein
VTIKEGQGKIAETEVVKKVIEKVIKKVTETRVGF